MLTSIKRWLRNLVEFILQFFIGKGLKNLSIYAAFAVFIVGLYATFVASTYAAVMALKPLAPAELRLGFMLMPSTTPLFLGAYFTALIAKRVFDWHLMILMERQRAQQGMLL